MPKRGNSWPHVATRIDSYLWFDSFHSLELDRKIEDHALAFTPCVQEVGRTLGRRNPGTASPAMNAEAAAGPRCGVSGGTVAESKGTGHSAPVVGLASAMWVVGWVRADGTSLAGGLTDKAHTGHHTMERTVTDDTVTVF